MHILLTTFGLLVILTLFCAAQWRAATDMVFLDTAAVQEFAEIREKAVGRLNNFHRKFYEKFAPPASQTKTSTSKVATNDPVVEDEEDIEDEEEAPIDDPDEVDEDKGKKSKEEKCTRHLSVADIFTGEEISIVDGKGRASFTILKNLVTTLYGGQEFFEEAIEEEPDLVELFLMNLFEKAKDAQQEKQWIKDADDLATLQLEDELHSFIRYKIFTGNKSLYQKESTDKAGYYPINEFISMRKRQKSIMSLWLAPKPLLMALFQNPNAVDELLEVRKEIYSEVRKSSTLASGKEQELRLRFSSYIDLDMVDYIDFKVTTTKPPDMPKTKK